jgi:hypothetical protein
MKMPSFLLCGGNKGGKMDKDRQGREEDRGEPSMVTSIPVGHLDQMMQDGL